MALAFEPATRGNPVYEVPGPASLIHRREYLSIGVTRRIAQSLSDRVNRRDPGLVGPELCRMLDLTFRGSTSLLKNPSTPRSGAQIPRHCSVLALMSRRLNAVLDYRPFL